MDDRSEDNSTGRKRFPFIDLEKAIDRASQIYASDRNGRSMVTMTAFEVWGYSGKSSGGFQTVAALKSYGLIDVERGKSISLSANALRYFRDERDEEKLRLRKLFALRPTLLGALWRHWGAAPPADNVARSHLKNDMALGEQQARSLLGIYKENLTFAELKSDDKVAEQDADEEEAELVTPGREPPAPAAHQRRQPVKVGMKEDTFNLEEGEVVMQWPERLSRESYEDLETWVGLQLRKIKRRIVESE